MAKRINMMLDDDAADLLPQLAGSSRKQGEFLSNLIRAAAQQAQSPVPDPALAELGRQVLRLVEQADYSLARQTALLSASALARLWDNPEEDAAWQHL
ncbi:MAG: hypothetical protein M3Z04_13190 [Chloroflexota bacterium]|nr:hypothetical protein [Chloroflexota bacterium]